MVSRSAAEYELYPGLSLAEVTQEPTLTLPGGIDISRFSRDERLLLQAVINQSLQIEEDTLRSLDISIDPNQDYIVFGLSDLHFGSSATDLAALYTMQQTILKIPNARIILLGDEIDGRGKYATNDHRNDKVVRQVDLFRAWLRPLYDAGKILCAVGEYNGHNGWVVDTNAVSWDFIFGEEMDIPIVGNGETVNLVDEEHDGTEVLLKLAVAHTSGKRSAVDPVHGLRILAHRSKADVAIAGHTHESGIERETEYGPDGKILKVALGNSGAFKGSSRDPKIPRDTFGQRLSMGDVSPGGSGTIYSVKLVDPQTSSKSIEGYPFIEPIEGMWLHAALKLLDRAESLGVIDELLEELRQPIVTRSEKSIKNKLKFNLAGSQSVVGQTQKEKEAWEEQQQANIDRLEKHGIEIPKGRAGKDWFNNPYSPVYQDLEVRYHPANHPFGIHLLSNLRVGSKSFEQREKQFEDYLAQLSNPWDLLLWLRGIVDKDTGGLKNRRDELDKVAAWMNQNAGRNIALLADGSLRTAAWKRMAKGFSINGYVTPEEMRKYGPIAPASYLSEMTGVQLIGNRSSVTLRIGHYSNEVIHKTRTMDKLGRSGSSMKPNFGLMRAYESFSEAPALTVGGHMQRSAFSKKYDANNAYTHFPLFISPGWWSEVDTLGKGNVMVGGPPGYAAVIVPFLDNFLQFGTQGYHEYKTLIDAMTLQLAAISDPKFEKLLRGI